MNIKSFFLTVILSTSAFAQNTSTTQLPDDGISSKGIRVSIVKPNLDVSVKANYSGNSFSGSREIDETLGAAIGYASLPVAQLGYTANLAIMEAKTTSSANLVRIDGNIGYAFNNFVNLKGGLNVMKFTSGNGFEDFNAGLGFQASLGVQITKNFGIDIGTTEMNTSGKSAVTSNGVEIGKADTDVKLKGFEVGLNATF